MKINKIIIISVIVLLFIGTITLFYLTKENPVKKQIEEVKKNPPKYLRLTKLF